MARHGLDRRLPEVVAALAADRAVATDPGLAEARRVRTLELLPFVGEAARRVEGEQRDDDGGDSNDQRHARSDDWDGKHSSPPYRAGN